MKNTFLLLFLAIGITSNSVLGQSQLPGDLNTIAPMDTLTSSAQTWKVLTEKENNQSVTITLDQELFIPFQIKNCDANHGDMYYKMEGDAILQEELKGTMHSNASDYNGNNFFLFKPTARGQTKLIFYRGKNLFWSTLRLAEFTINVE